MSKALCIFGEVLFDVFPDGHRVLGGAPFNVAWHLQAFAQAPFFISRVGNDSEGVQIRKTMLEWGMDTSAVQTDDNLSSGMVNIELIDGEPKYDIVMPSAYDNIAVLPQSDACQMLYHGSLALRNEQSVKALKSLLQASPGIVFLDVNLRAPWWNKTAVLEMLNHAHWVKLNEEELNFLYPSDKDLKSRLADFNTELNLTGVIVTHGEKGAEILTADKQYYSIKPEKSADIADTVGAGDAFSSVVIMGLKNNWPLSETIKRAQQFASAIVQKRGAVVNDRGFYNNFLTDWGLD